MSITIFYSINFSKMIGFENSSFTVNFVLRNSRMSDIFQSAELKIPLYQEFLPIVLSYVENTSKIFKLNAQEIPQVILAVEEIFSFLVFNAKRADTLSLTMRFRGSYIEVIAKFAAEMLPVESLNLTTKISTDDDNALGYMGLLIAARSVDSLRLNVDDDGYMYLHFIKNKQYSRLPPSSPLQIDFSGSYVVEDIDTYRIPEFCTQAVSEYGGSDVAEFLCYPQKLTDMITRGDYDGCFALDTTDKIAGALFWESSGEMINGKGFFIFAKKDKETVANILMEGCKSRTSILRPHCLFIEHSTTETPIDFLRVGKHAAYHPMYAGDKPASVYINSGLVSFVKSFYRKINVIRNIYEQMSGEAIRSITSEHSAFAVSIDKFSKAVNISILWVGKDAVENLQNHIEALKSEGLSYLVFDLAIEKPEQAIMGDFLLQAGFKPEVVIPWTKEGDILRFSYDLRR